MKKIYPKTSKLFDIKSTETAIAFFALFFAFSLFQTFNLNAQIPYLEIKNHRAQTAIYGQIDLFQKRSIKKYPKFEVKLPTVDTFAVQKIAIDLTHSTPPDDTLDILIYIHAMWGGVDFHTNKILRTFSTDILAPQGSIDKILPIIWHSGLGYRSNLQKANTIGESLAENIGYIMQQTREMSKSPVRFHLLCHSMGHQVFRGVYNSTLRLYLEPFLKCQSVLFFRLTCLFFIRLISCFTGD